MNKTKIYIKSILIPLIVGGVVGFLISKSMDYNTVQKPFLAPPSLTFPIVWTILYILMGISYGILKSKDKIDTNINVIYYMQLAVNALWPIFFFVFKWRLFSFAWIILLLVCVTVMLIKFWQKNRTAGILQIPYMIWVLFASYLNLGVYILNK